MNKAKIKYLFHSGYSIETASHTFIFDYYQPRPLGDGMITAESLTGKENVYVFCSHSHGDHYDPIILEWAKANPSIHYILSNDITVKNKTLDCVFLAPYEEWRSGDIAVKTYGSTDAGVSFLVKADGLNIFHAGDLNWWHWSGETKAERDWADNYFKTEMEKLAGETIDIAMFPVDQRLEENYSIGAEYFAAQMHPKLLLPMHFGETYATTAAFAAKAKDLAINTVAITRKGQEIIF
ncbi:MAG: MBL fold metallo-hydrolase [Negativicutes bacterium]|nr:MBL fold metallo-hydrolase [Negativicutes bacterium]